MITIQAVSSTLRLRLCLFILGILCQLQTALCSANETFQFSQLGNDIDGVGANGYFGRSVSLSENGLTVAIGASQHDAAIGENAGLVQVFNFISGSWVQKGQGITGNSAQDILGVAVSLSSDGNVLAIGAPANGFLSNVGYVKVFTWNSTGWVQRGTDIVGAIFEGVGKTVSLSGDGNLLAIGAPFSVDGSEQKGSVRVYEWNSSSWIQRGSDIYGDSESGRAGSSVAISKNGNVVAMGAIFNNNNGNSAGQVRVFEWATNAWIQIGQSLSGEEAGDESGVAVAINGDGSVIAIGAGKNDGAGIDSGHLRVFELESGTWIQRGDDIDGKKSGYEFGKTLSLSMDGNVVASGSIFDSSRAGHAQIYEWKTTSWVQKGADIIGEIFGDDSGSAVSLSGNGNVIAVGATNSRVGGEAVGHVRIFEFITPSPTAAPTSSPTSAPTSSPTSTRSETPALGRLVGGICGGLTLLGMFIGIASYRTKRGTKSKDIESLGSA